MTTLELRHESPLRATRDGNGRFVTRELAALWADHCSICCEARDQHVGLRPATGQPFCPILGVTGLPVADEPHKALRDGLLDGTSFDAASPADCTDPARHEVGCDCSLYCR